MSVLFIIIYLMKCINQFIYPLPQAKEEQYSKDVYNIIFFVFFAVWQFFQEELPTEQMRKEFAHLTFTYLLPFMPVGHLT